MSTATIERWRMPSGQIGTIDLDQDQGAVDVLRDSLRDAGASPVDENAPGAGGNQPEGVNQKPAEDSVWSKATRRARAAAAVPGTVAADHRIVIEDEPDRESASVTLDHTVSRRNARLAESILASLPVVFVNNPRRRAHVWRTGDGGWWRRGGGIRIQRWVDGKRAFVVFVHKGANGGDIRHLLDIVARTRRGENFDYLWSPVDAEWADDLTFVCAASRAYNDPYTHRDLSPKVTVCDVDLCRDQWHEGEPLHEVDSAEGPGYTITVCRFDEDDEWRIDVDAAGAEFTPDEIAVFVNDLQWMRSECERANAAKGSQP